MNAVRRLGLLLALCASAPAAPTEPAQKACTKADYVRAGDVIGDPPKGFQVTPIQDKQALDGFMEQFESVLGNRLRGYDSKVLFRRGARLGTVVITVNATEETGDSEDFLRGAEDAAAEAGRAARRSRSPASRAASSGPRTAHTSRWLPRGRARSLSWSLSARECCARRSMPFRPAEPRW